MEEQKTNQEQQNVNYADQFAKTEDDRIQERIAKEKAAAEEAIKVEAKLEESVPVKDPLRLVAFILMLLTTIGAGILIIPLTWCIPMTVHCWRAYKGTARNTTAFGVCTLLFVNLISGILLLCSEKD